MIVQFDGQVYVCELVVSAIVIFVSLLVGPISCTESVIGFEPKSAVTICGELVTGLRVQIELLEVVQLFHDVTA